MKIGITATRKGLSEGQLGGILDFLTKFQNKIESLHHGDCVGGDVEVATIAKSLHIKTVAHPPIIDTLRAYFHSSETLTPKPYRNRNRDIVKVIDILLVAPQTSNLQQKSGTLYTYNFALKLNKKCILFLP